MDSKHKRIRDYWDEMAQKNKYSSLATSPDTIAFFLELEQMVQRIPEKSKVLDIGCGNGVKGMELVKRINIDYTGMDFSEEMVESARDLQHRTGKTLGKALFKVGNILNREDFPEPEFDFVLTDRCLINLPELALQIKGVCHISHVLKEEGYYFMFENSRQALGNLNQVRSLFSLPEITERWHNHYIDEENFFPSIHQWFSLTEVVPFASTYYLLSRTLNALLTPSGKPVDYLSPLNHYASRLPPLGDYSPLKLFVLQKRKEINP